jgi:hypothetical protein
VIEKQEAIHRAERAKREFGPVSRNEWEQIGALIEGLMLYCEEVNPEKLWNKVVEEVHRLHHERMRTDPAWLAKEAELRMAIHNSGITRTLTISPFDKPKR